MKTLTYRMNSDPKNLLAINQNSYQELVNAKLSMLVFFPEALKQLTF
jgi:hypothetical protein